VLELATSGPAGVPFRPAPKAKPELVHTLNGAGLALPRAMIAVSRRISARTAAWRSEVLRPYMGGIDVAPA
jgi:seryl-tRNA synthetase